MGPEGGPIIQEFNTSMQHKSDLKSKFHVNKLFKFADGTNLLVPEFTDIDMKDEFDAILTWATVNKMLLNMTKTKELVFHRPSPNNY